MSRNSQSSTSKHYVFKKQEAERIDFENRKLMARIVGSAGTIKARVVAPSSYNRISYLKQIHNENTSITTVENIIQNKKRMMETVNSSYLPVIDTKASLMHQEQSEK